MSAWSFFASNYLICDVETNPDLEGGASTGDPRRGGSSIVASGRNKLYFVSEP